MKSAAMTGLERMVAQRLLEGTDPWHGARAVGSGKVSKALGRLNRKGLARYYEGDWHLTPEGHRALELARR